MIIESKYGIYENKKLLNISFNSKDEAKAYVNYKFKHLEDNNKASNYIFNDFVNSKIKERLKNFKIKKIKVITINPTI
jgi:hypothetical protein